MEFSGTCCSRIHHCDWISNDYYFFFTVIRILIIIIFVGETEHTPPVERVNSFKKLDLILTVRNIYGGNSLLVGFGQWQTT